MKKPWPLNRPYFIIVLVVGFFVTAPFVLGYMGDYWWVALPALASWTVVLWVWGVRIIWSPEEIKAASVATRLLGVLIMLGQSLVGMVLAVFLTKVLIRNWIALLLGLLIVGVCILFWGRDPPNRKHVSHPAAAVGAGPDQASPEEPGKAVAAQAEPPPDSATFQYWVRHHLSLLLFAALGVATVVEQVHNQTFAIGWLGKAAVLAYAAVIWIHVVAPQKPGEPPSGLVMKLFMTVLYVIMTFVAFAVLFLITTAIGKFWIWVVPPVALVALFFALNWGNPAPESEAAVAAPKVVHGGRKHRDTIVR